MNKYEDDLAVSCKYPFVIPEAGTQTEIWKHLYTEDVFD
jgi:hypothetical protein